MDIPPDPLTNPVVVAVELLAQSPVLKCLQSGDPAVDHTRREDPVLLKRLGRFDTGGRGLSELREVLPELRAKYVPADIEPLGHIESVRHLDPPERSHDEAGDDQVGIGRTVGDPVLERLLRWAVLPMTVLAGVGVAGHAVRADPAERNPDHDRAVAVAPADRRRRLLVGDETEVGGRDGVPEGRQGVGGVEDAGDHLPGERAQPALLDRQVPTVLLDKHVEVHPAPGLADGDLRGEADLDAVPVAEHPQDPLRDDQLLDRLLHRHRQELDLVLLVVGVAVIEAPDLRVAVLDPASGTGNEAHRLVPEIRELDEGFGRVVAPLVAAGVEVVPRADDVVLEFAEGLEGAAGPAGELLVRLAEHVLGGALERFPVAVVERAEELKRRHLGKRVHERRAVAGDDVEIAAPRLDEREEVAAVDALAVREDGIEVFP